jgi:hypothetical protein
LSIAGLPGFWLGFLSFFLIVDRVQRFVLGKKRYQENLQRGMNRWGDYRPFLYRIVAFVTFATAIGVALCMDFYASFEEDRIVINRFWGIGEVSYSYSRVRAMVYITHVRNVFGTIFRLPRPQVVLVFDDGTSWSPALGQGQAQLEEDSGKIVALIQKKTGIPLTSVRFIEDAQLRD